MPSIIVLLCVVALTCWWDARPAHAQSTAASAGVEIEIKGGAALAETCLTVQSLSARVAHYSSPSARSRGVRLVLYLSGPHAAELHILRGGEVVSRRMFARLPAPCADKRDAVALSIALALERAAAAAAPGGGTPRARAAQPVGAAVDGAARASDTSLASGSSTENAASDSGRGAVVRPGLPDGRGVMDNAAAEGGSEGVRPRRTGLSGGVAAGSGSGGRQEGPDGGNASEDAASSGSGGVAAGSGRGGRQEGPDGGSASEDAASSGGVSGADTRRRMPDESESGSGSAGDRNEPIILGSLPTTTSRDPRRAATSSLQLHLGGRFTLQAVPAPVWALALGVELPLSAAATLGITGLLSSVGEAPLAGARARANFLGIEAVGCRNVALGSLMLQACAGAAVALCEASGRDYPRARPEATLLWAAVLGRATLRWPREGSIAGRLLLQPHVSISRPELRVEGSTERLRSFWLGGSVGLELWLALP